LQFIYYCLLEMKMKSHNPYFTGNSFAIKKS